MAEPRINLRKHNPQPEAIQLIPEIMARKYMAIPVSIVGNALKVAMANPSDIFALEALANQSHLRVEPQSATAEEIQEAIDFNYKSYAEIEKQVSNISIIKDKSMIRSVLQPLLTLRSPRR
jgi:general secretion pathway protein E